MIFCAYGAYKPVELYTRELGQLVMMAGHRKQVLSHMANETSLAMRENRASTFPIVRFMA